VTNPQALPDISADVRAQLAAVMAGEPYDSPVPDDIRAAIHAGHVGQTSIYCDECGTTETMDCVGEYRQERFDAARQHLIVTKGWQCNEDADLCPTCAAAEGA
jgi:hypothetical protein